MDDDDTDDDTGLLNADGGVLLLFALERPPDLPAALETDDDGSFALSWADIFEWLMSLLSSLEVANEDFEVV